jgi:hypothetical protein
MMQLGRILAEGDAKYERGQPTPLGQENWRAISEEDHINHAINHLINALREIQHGTDFADDEAGQHLGHAFCRVMFAIGVQP